MKTKTKWLIFLLVMISILSTYCLIVLKVINNSNIISTELKSIGGFFNNIITPILTFSSVLFLGYNFFSSKDKEIKQQKREQLESMILGLKNYLRSSYVENGEDGPKDSDYIVCVNSSLRLCMGTDDKSEYDKRVEDIKKNNKIIRGIGSNHLVFHYDDMIRVSNRILNYLKIMFDFVIENEIHNYTYMFLCQFKAVDLHTFKHLFKVPAVLKQSKSSESYLKYLEKFYMALSGAGPEPFNEIFDN